MATGSRLDHRSLLGHSMDFLYLHNCIARGLHVLTMGAQTTYKMGNAFPFRISDIHNQHIKSKLLQQTFRSRSKSEQQRKCLSDTRNTAKAPRLATNTDAQTSESTHPYLMYQMHHLQDIPTTSVVQSTLMSLIAAQIATHPAHIHHGHHERYHA